MKSAKKQNKAEAATVRTSLRFKPSSIESLKYVAFKSKKTLTDIMDQALTDYINKWVKKNGEIPK